MKVIFLDIDGVLNYQLMWQEKRQADRYKEYPEDAPKQGYDICEKKIQLLNTLVKDTGAKVVISSSWRTGNTVEYFQELFKYRGFEGEIIDKTPYLWFQGLEDYHYSVPRGCEIKAWIETHKGILGDKVSKFKYVIFDDDSEMLYWQRNNYFQVDSYCGLTPNLIYRATRFLNS